MVNPVKGAGDYYISYGLTGLASRALADPMYQDWNRVQAWICVEKFARGVTEQLGAVPLSVTGSFVQDSMASEYMLLTASGQMLAHLENGDVIRLMVYLNDVYQSGGTFTIGSGDIQSPPISSTNLGGGLHINNGGTLMLTRVASTQGTH